MKGLSQKITETSANLQGSTFTTGRTAEQMGDQSRYGKISGAIRRGILSLD